MRTLLFFSSKKKQKYKLNPLVTLTGISNPLFIKIIPANSPNPAKESR